MISPVQTYSCAASLISISLASSSFHFLQLDSNSHKKTTHRHGHAKCLRFLGFSDYEDSGVFGLGHVCKHSKNPAIEQACFALASQA
ncbi:hypothetical protein C1H46_006098 [Malus baccata]|uniref:Uncharacterized protein n=1 Tax=Malus baccata TaxID=106549 RepID=A0A540NB94_MALBA|nr:hypothetical protein C1H46_006098 [Malus baccata]